MDDENTDGRRNRPVEAVTAPAVVTTPGDAAVDPVEAPVEEAPVADEPVVEPAPATKTTAKK